METFLRIPNNKPAQDLQSHLGKFGCRFCQLTDKDPIREEKTEGDPHYKAMSCLFTAKRSFGRAE